MQVLLHLRAVAPGPAFKLVLMANGSGLDLPVVRQGLRKLTSCDEIWIKLDAATRSFLSSLCTWYLRMKTRSPWLWGIGRTPTGSAQLPAFTACG
jgi:hypothetical protein